MLRGRCYLMLEVLIQCSVQPDNWLILQKNFYTSIAFGLTEHHELNNSSYLFAILILLWGLLHINSSNSLRLSGKIHNAKSTIILKTGYCVLQIMKHFTLFYFRELTSTFTKLESLVQIEMENLEENIIKLDQEITRLEEIKNKSITLR